MNNIQDFLNSKQSITVSISVDDLNEFLTQIVTEKSNGNNPQEVTTEFRTAKQTGSMLHVDLSTLWRWEKSGYLVPSRIGRKRMYKLSDLQAILEK